MIARRSLILDPLRELRVAPEEVTHVFLSHYHPDHTVDIALFPNPEVVDFWARFRDDLWLDHDGDGYHLSANNQLWLTPGHTEEDATLVVEAHDGVDAMTHLWWREDRSPAEIPWRGTRALAWDQGAIDQNRARVLAAADVVIAGTAGLSASRADPGRPRSGGPHSG